MKTKLYTILTILFLFIFACKPDCKRNIVLKQEYKPYQSWYPYKEFDTIHFQRIPEMDTIVLYGSKYTYPIDIIYVACDCCDDEHYEFIKQNFISSDNSYTIQLEMKGRNMEFYMFKTYFYNYDFGGNEILYSTVITPDSNYTMANKKVKGNQSCYYAPKVGIVKYSFDSTHHWLFLRNL